MACGSDVCQNPIIWPAVSSIRLRLDLHAACCAQWTGPTCYTQHMKLDLASTVHNSRLYLSCNYMWHMGAGFGIHMAGSTWG